MPPPGPLPLFSGIKPEVKNLEGGKSLGLNLGNAILPLGGSSSWFKGFANSCCQSTKLWHDEAPKYPVSPSGALHCAAWLVPLGAIRLSTICPRLQWLCVSPASQWLGMRQLVPVGARVILGLCSRLQQLLSSLLRPLQVNTVSTSDKSGEDLQWLWSFLPVAFKAIMEQHLRVPAVRATFGAWDHAVCSAKSSATPEGQNATTGLVQVGSFVILAICGRLQHRGSCSPCCSPCYEWRLRELVWMESSVILAVHVWVPTMLFNTSRRTSSGSNGRLWTLVPMGVSSFLAVRGRLRRLRGFGKSAERNPAIIPCASKACCTVWVTRHYLYRSPSHHIWSARPDHVSFVFSGEVGPFVSGDRCGIGKSDPQIQVQHPSSDFVGWIGNMQTWWSKKKVQCSVLIRSKSGRILWNLMLFCKNGSPI